MADHLMAMRRWSGKVLYDPRRFSRIGRRAVPAHEVKDWPDCAECVSRLGVLGWVLPIVRLRHALGLTLQIDLRAATVYPGRA